MSLDSIPSKDCVNHRPVSPNTSIQKTIMGITAGVALLVGNQACGGKHEEVQTNSTVPSAPTMVQAVPSATQEPHSCPPEMQVLPTNDSLIFQPQEIRHLELQSEKDYPIPSTSKGTSKFIFGSPNPKLKFHSNPPLTLSRSQVSVECVKDPSRKFDFGLNTFRGEISILALPRDPEGKPLPPDKDSCDDKGGYKFVFDLGQ